MPHPRRLPSPETATSGEMTDSLTKLGYEVVGEAKDGEEGVRKAAELQPDAILMDMQMPVMDGLAATRLLRQNPAWANLPVLAMTANAMSRDRDLCLEAGMNEVMSKPLDERQMIDQISKVLKQDSKEAA